jgi:hypothetical protein
MRPYDFASLAGYIFIAHNSYKSVGARVITDAETKWIAANYKWCWDNPLFIVTIIIIIDNTWRSIWSVA